MENSLSYVIFSWFLASTTHQQIIFMFLVKTKLVKTLWKFKIFPSSINGEIPQKIRYMNNVRRGVICLWHLYASIEITYS